MKFYLLGNTVLPAKTHNIPNGFGLLTEDHTSSLSNTGGKHTSEKRSCPNPALSTPCPLRFSRTRRLRLNANPVSLFKPDHHRQRQKSIGIVPDEESTGPDGAAVKPMHTNMLRCICGDVREAQTSFSPPAF